MRKFTKENLFLFKNSLSFQLARYDSVRMIIKMLVVMAVVVNQWLIVNKLNVNNVIVEYQSNWKQVFNIWIVMVSFYLIYFRKNFNQKKTSFSFFNQQTAFKETYKEYKIWELFRRNFKGQFSPAVPRLSCVGADGFLKTSNPCVVCRDRNLLVHHKVFCFVKKFFYFSFDFLF